MDAVVIAILVISLKHVAPETHHYSMLLAVRVLLGDDSRCVVRFLSGASLATTVVYPAADS